MINTKSETTKELFLNTVIPAVERMIEREEAHLKELKEQRARSCYIFIDVFIASSQKSLAHLQRRLGEYREYVV